MSKRFSQTLKRRFLLAFPKCTESADSSSQLRLKELREPTSTLYFESRDHLVDVVESDSDRNPTVSGLAPRCQPHASR